VSKHFPGRTQDGASASAPEARGAAAALDKMGSRVSLEEERAAERRADRRRLRDAVGRILPTEAVARCGRYTGRTVEVAGRFASPIMQGKHGSYFGNIITCGSVWHCPVCAAKVAEERRREIAHIVTACQVAGCNAFMLTFTQGHRGFHEPRPLRQGLSRRWRRMLAGKAWQEIRETCFIAGFCRALEVTHGKNGWHPHLHILVFFGPTASSREIGRALSWLTARWVRYTLADGYECSESAQDLRNVTVAGAAGDYVTKFGVDWEMSHAHLKKGRGGRSPFQILADYVSIGWVPDADLFKQYALAFKGARQLTWSGRIRKMFPEAIENMTREIYRKDHTARPVCIITDDTMRDIDGAGIRELVLDTADELGLQGVLWALRSNGVGVSGVFPPKDVTF